MWNMNKVGMNIFFLMKEENLMINTLYLVTESTKSSLFTVNNGEFDRFTAKHETHEECLHLLCLKSIIMLKGDA